MTITPQRDLQWPKIVGCLALCFGIAFFSGLALLNMVGYDIHGNGRVFVAILAGLLLGTGFGFLGGSLDVRGSIPIPRLEIRPIHFAATDGVAAFIIGMLLVWLVTAG